MLAMSFIRARLPSPSWLLSVNVMLSCLLLNLSMLAWFRRHASLVSLPCLHGVSVMLAWCFCHASLYRHIILGMKLSRDIIEIVEFGIIHQLGEHSDMNDSLV